MGKTPLHYQISNFDCGPTTMLNAISFLFPRDQIPAEVVRNIMLYSLDTYSCSGRCGESGTSRTAMMFLSNWLNGFAEVGSLRIRTQYLSGAEASLEESGSIVTALRCRGAAVLRVMLDEWHYVLGTGVEGDMIQIFDPYYDETEEFIAPGILRAEDHPDSCNRLVPLSFFRAEEGLYSMGEVRIREAVLLFNKGTELTPEKTIEYFI